MKIKGIGTALLGAAALTEIPNAVKKSKAEMKLPTPGGKFDNILNNKITNTDEFGKIKTASSFIDELYLEKFAEENNEDKSKKIIPGVLGAALLGLAIADAKASGNALKPLKDVASGAKSVIYDLPKLWLKNRNIGRTTRVGLEGVRRGARNLRNDSKGKKVFGDSEKPGGFSTFLKGVGVGAGIGAGNLGVHLIGDKYFNKDKNKTNVIQKSYDSVLEPVSEVYHQRQNRREANKYKDNRRKDSNGYNRRKDNYNRNREKRASDLIDNLFEKKAVANFSGPKHFLKTVVKEDILQNAIKSVPFMTVPLGVGYAMNKDLRYDGRPIKGKKGERFNTERIIIEMPVEDIKKKMNKKASIEKEAVPYRDGIKRNYKRVYDKLKNKAKPTENKKLYESMPWKNFFKHEMPRTLARSLSWVVPVTALTAITGRNLRGVGEKIDKSEPLEPGKARITIDKRPKYSHGYDFDSRHA